MEKNILQRHVQLFGVNKYQCGWLTGTVKPYIMISPQFLRNQHTIRFNPIITINNHTLQKNLSRSIS